MHSRSLYIAILMATVFCWPAVSVSAQQAGTVRLRVVHNDSVPLPGAVVSAGATAARTDAAGMAVLQLTPARHAISVVRIGFSPDSISLTVRAGSDTSIIVNLTERNTELGAVLVTTTRTQRRIEDEPTRVEVLGKEEVEEKLLMTPGDITMMLNETSGLRVQTTSPSLGGASVRIQGLLGRYTRILADGLPLYGAQTGGLGLLQIPPMDLGGVEIIKGVASALHGSSALGGVINLISRTPEGDPQREFLLNRTSLGGTDAVTFMSSVLSPQWGYTLLAGGHVQERRDVGSDGWTDVPGYRRALVRPRLFWSGTGGGTALLTLGATTEDRKGGSLPGRTAPDGFPYPEALRTVRVDAGAIAQWPLSPIATLSVRGSAASQKHRHTFGSVVERDRHLTWFGEASVNVQQNTMLWTVGAAMEQEAYRSDDVAGFDFTYSIPALFVQNTFAPGERVAATVSGRVDAHDEFGTVVSPRVSLLYRATEEWSVRASLGRGFFGPTPFTEETEVTGLTRLDALGNLRVERARSASVDVGGAIGPIEINVTAFGSEISRPVSVRESSPGRIEVINLAQPTRTTGGELLARFEAEPFHVTATYTYVHSTDVSTGARARAPLTPLHQAGLVTMLEQEGSARAGIEIYYTGRQRLHDNPFRTESKPYVHIGILGEKRFGNLRLFVNAENLLNVRQTRTDPLLLPVQGEGGRWTTDVWSPLDGAVVNAGIRIGG